MMTTKRTSFRDIYLNEYTSINGQTLSATPTALCSLATEYLIDTDVMKTPEHWHRATALLFGGSEVRTDTIHGRVR